MVPSNLLIADLVFCNWIRASLVDINDISNDYVKPLRALRFSLILVLGAGTGCCFFVVGAGIGLYCGIGLASKYCINCRTFLLLLGAGIGRAPPNSWSGDRAICFFPYINQILKFTHCDPR